MGLRSSYQHRLRDWLAGLLVALVLAAGALLPGALPVQAAQLFADVPDTHPQAVYINDLAQAGIVVKSGRFRPQDNISRAELLKMVMGGAGHTLVTLTVAPTFVDVRQDNSFFPWVETAVRRGFIHGYRDYFGRFTWLFKPWDQVTRGEAIKMVVASLELTLPAGAISPSFSDVTGQDSFWEFIRIANAQGLLLASAGQALQPSQKVTRAEVAKLVSVARAVRQGVPPPSSNVPGSGGATSPGSTSPPPAPADVELRLTAGANIDRSIMSGENNVLLLSLEVTPLTARELVLRRLVFKRQGVGDRADFLGLNLFVAGQRVAGPYTIAADNNATFLLNVLPPALAASGPTTIELRGTVKAGVSLAEHIFSIETAGDFVLAAKNSTDLAPVGITAIFPLKSGRLRIAQGSGAASLQVLFTPAKSGTETYRLGGTRVGLGTLTLSATGEDIILSQLIMTARGSYTEVANLELLNTQSNLPVGNRVPSLSNLKAVFDFSQEPSGGLQINDRQTRSFLLRGDLTPSDAGRIGTDINASEVLLIIEAAADITAKGRLSSLGVQVQLQP